jgi:hypothetical protein
MSADIQNCHQKFRDQCPGDWEVLDPTDDPRERLCEVCGHKVRLCQSRDEALYLDKAGRRVALESEG